MTNKNTFYTLREKAIELLVNRYYCYCQCGEKLVPWFEGELICPVEDDNWTFDMTSEQVGEVTKNHKYENSWGGDLDCMNLLIELFNIDEMEVKEEHERRKENKKNSKQT